MRTYCIFVFQLFPDRICIIYISRAEDDKAFGKECFLSLTLERSVRRERERERESRREREQANKFSGGNNGAWHPKNVRNRALQCHTLRLDWKWTWPIPHLNRDFAKCVVGRYLNHASVKNIRDKSESCWRRFSNTGVAIPFGDDLIWGASSLQPWNRMGIDETQCGFKSIDDSAG